jgi:putative ABC transport system permease protein
MSLPHDVRHALRLIRRAPWFTAASVSVLGLGIGVTTAIFSLVDAALVRPLPFRDADRLIMVWERSATNPRSPAALGNFYDWRQQSATAIDMAGSVGVTQAPVSDGTGLPEAAWLQTVTSGFFEVLGVTPLMGRTFTAQDDVTVGGTGSLGIGLVMSERFWRSRFGADPAMVGKTINIGSPPRAVPVIGIVPAGFQIFGVTDLFEHLPINTSDIRGARALRVIGRLKPEATLDQARADFTRIARTIEKISPATNNGWSVTVEPLQEAIIGSELRTTTLMLGGVVLFVLLLACANIANLMLARGVGRAREIAVRAALGGTRWRIGRQLLAESAALGVLGGVAGLGVAWALLRLAPAMVPPQAIPVGIVLALDWRVGLFALAATLTTALLFGLAPAWQAAHVSLVDAMSAGGRGSSDRAGRVRQGLAVLEIAVALLLMTGAGLLERTLASLNRVDAGYRAENVVTMSLRLPFRRLVAARPGELPRYWQSIDEAVASVPGVRVAALGSNVPLGGISYRQPFEVVGAPVADRANRPVAHFNVVSSQYFAALGVPLIRGRAFTDRDAYDATPVAVVNEEFVRRHLAGRNPIGERVTVQSLTFPVRQVVREIIGVVRQVKSRPDEPSDNALQIYVPIAQNDWMDTTIIARAAGDPLSLVQQIKAAIGRVDPTQAVSQVRTLEDVAAAATSRPRFRAQLVTAFALMALALAAVGIFSVLTFMVQQRAREFGVRLAMGASASNLLRLVLVGGLKLTALGVVIGIAASAALVRSLATLLFGVPPLDPLTFVVAPLALTVVALLACLAPAIRALRADPIAALRAE